MGKALRILHTESSKGWGGQENRTLNEMTAMRARGHELAVIGQTGARILGRAEEAGFQTFTVDMRGALDLPALLKLRGLIRQFRADVVNTHSSRDTQLAGMAAYTLSNRPRIVRTRHLALPITSKFTYSVLPDQVVSVSSFVGEYLVSAGVPRSQVTAIPTGIDLSRYAADQVAGDLRRELGLPDNTVLIGTVAILRIKKGHVEVLEAAKTVLETWPNVHFVIAGDGPQQANLIKRIEMLGLESRVHMLGLRRDVTNILKSLDLFVLPTYQEALGTAFIEAGAMGLPVIATAVDGVPEVVVDQETGLLVPAKDTPALAKAILELLGNHERRQEMGIQAKKRIEERFSREAMAEGMETLYNRLLAEK